jgi:hypothetical protein
MPSVYFRQGRSDDLTTMTTTAYDYRNATHKSPAQPKSELLWLWPVLRTAVAVACAVAACL